MVADDAATEAPLHRNGEGVGEGLPTRRSGYATARAPRRRQTPAEALLWSRLRGNALGEPFRRQHPVGPFVVDRLCPRYVLIVELDGGIHGRPDVQEQDRWREDWLICHGLLVVRIANGQVLDDIDGVLAQLRVELAVRKNSCQRLTTACD